MIVVPCWWQCNPVTFRMLCLIRRPRVSRYECFALDEVYIVLVIREGVLRTPWANNSVLAAASCYCKAPATIRHATKLKTVIILNRTPKMKKTKQDRQQHDHTEIQAEGLKFKSKIKRMKFKRKSKSVFVQLGIFFMTKEKTQTNQIYFMFGCTRTHSAQVC